MEHERIVMRNQQYNNARGRLLKAATAALCA
jgi:hypothetical protein